MISKSSHSFFAFSGSRVPAFTDYHLTPTQGLSQCDGERTHISEIIDLRCDGGYSAQKIHKTHKLSPFDTRPRETTRLTLGTWTTPWCKIIFNTAVRLLCYILHSTSEAGILSKDKHIWHSYVYILLFPPAIFQTNSLYNIFTIFPIL